MTIERRAQALLELVESDRARQCDAIVAEARAHASTLLAQAHAEARARVRQAFKEERARSAARIAAARAALATRQRLDRQQRASALVATGLARLIEELLRRWREPATRRVWCDAIAADASSVLTREPWDVAHPADWPEVEQSAFASRVAAEVGTSPRLRADPRIRAGLRIAAGGNVVDGTLDGLLADREEIGARLLHAIEVEQ